MRDRLDNNIENSNTLSAEPNTTHSHHEVVMLNPVRPAASPTAFTLPFATRIARIRKVQSVQRTAKTRGSTPLSWLNEGFAHQQAFPVRMAKARSMMQVIE